MKADSLIFNKVAFVWTHSKNVAPKFVVISTSIYLKLKQISN